jgi:NADH-quinone oxidoreductase subunit J
MIQGFNLLDVIVLSIAVLLCGFIVISKNVVKVFTAFFALLVMVGLIFLISGAEFLFATQLILYVGAVTILFVFAIMLSKRLTQDRNLVSENKNLLAGMFVAVVAFGTLILSVKKQSVVPKIELENSSKIIGKEVMSSYLFAFELLGIFLLIALVLAVVIAGKKQEK